MKRFLTIILAIITVSSTVLSGCIESGTNGIDVTQNITATDVEPGDTTDESVMPSETDVDDNGESRDDEPASLSGDDESDGKKTDDNESDCADDLSNSSDRTDDKDNDETVKDDKSTEEATKNEGDEEPQNTTPVSQNTNPAPSNQTGEHGSEQSESNSGNSGEHSGEHSEQNPYVPANHVCSTYMTSPLNSEKHEVYCIVCGKVKETEAHTWVKDEANSKAATYDEEGVNAWRCKCGHTKSETIAKLVKPEETAEPAGACEHVCDGHYTINNYVYMQNAATHSYVCTKCGETVTEKCSAKRVKTERSDGSSCQVCGRSFGVSTDKQMQELILKYFNEERVKGGLNSVVYNPAAQYVADLRSKQASENWSHKPFYDVYLNGGYQECSTIGASEILINLSYGNGSDEDRAKRAVETWMASYGHKIAIMNELSTNVVIGCYYVTKPDNAEGTGGYRIYISAIFGV